MSRSSNRIDPGNEIASTAEPPPPITRWRAARSVVGRNSIRLAKAHRDTYEHCVEACEMHENLGRRHGRFMVISFQIRRKESPLDTILVLEQPRPSRTGRSSPWWHLAKVLSILGDVPGYFVLDLSASFVPKQRGNRRPGIRDPLGSTDDRAQPLDARVSDPVDSEPQGWDAGGLVVRSGSPVSRGGPRVIL